jgi:acetyl-CoA acetyltransferase
MIGSLIQRHLLYTMLCVIILYNLYRYGVGAACIGGGQGIAVILENVTF